MSRVTFHGYGVWCFNCQEQHQSTDECEHGLSRKGGIRKDFDGEYHAQAEDMGHYSPCVRHDVDGYDMCLECGDTIIPNEEINNG